ncbi:trifunctional serine/threonine-protein kinase/ATP-binding protein/sensor histidine kinase [Hyalangium gracile]|uniref:trifunctional serine/threonine-protein kinase/ATP-binding protein/sensor histidine kinase n=1 Tax=Hyalangium gracile TaxID=394092 RepID=UPI001CCE13BF|nr:ATP-binding sensor histidine kinase [Hyalangium gracile]
MLTLPGYTLRGAVRATGTHLLCYGVRERDGASVMLKTPTSVSPAPREAERYRREFRILQRLRDVRGVARVVGYEQIQDRPVLLMEPVEGVPLSELTGRPLAVAQALDVAVSLASTLAALHRRGVIHKDIKPAHILVTPSGETCLIDFGIATFQLVEHVEAAPAPHIEGTLAYMSPEQTGRMNRSVDYRTDLYSLGVTLYELLAGSLPFQASDALEWFHAHMARVPPPLSERVPGLPPILSAIVSKLLAKVAEERYQSAEGLKADLDRCQESVRRGVHEDFAIGGHDFPNRFQLPQRLYGRDTHAALLLQSFERVARAGKPELVLVRGYSGIGKSAVVNELHKPVVRQRGFFLSGKFDQLQRNIPYATLAQALRGLTQQLLAGSDEALARWSGLLKEAWEGYGQLLVDVVPQLELVAGRQPPMQELPPAQAQHRFNTVFRKSLGVFATPEHPLVIFLDDLQWADLASLQLIQHLLTHPETPPVLWIGAYRDNEVDAAHPLRQVLTELRKAGVRTTEVQLEPLSLEEVRQLVADTLPGAGPELVGPLAVVVRAKTGGNPFFLLQLLQTLNQDGLLVRTPEGSWRWDAEGIQARGYSDNVVDFMVGKLRQFPPRTQHLLRLAACVGSSFTRSLLHLISDLAEGSELEQGLEPALQEGMVVRAGQDHYRFLHDRIQQAAYALIPEPDRKAIHLRIGRLLLASIPPEALPEKLFGVVSQLNAGAELIDAPAERRRLALLNADAGRKAKVSTAFRSASAYFATAFQLLPGSPWETEPKLAFTFQLEQATCDLMSGNAVEARRRVEELLTRARTRVEMGGVYRLKSMLLIASGEIEAAAECLLECLAQMGMSMSLRPSWEEVKAANDELWAMLGDRPIESLADLPRMADPDMEVLMSVLSLLFLPAYLTDHRLLTLQLCRMLLILLQHGNTAAAAHAYAWYGVVTGPMFKRYREGYAFGRLALELVERHELGALRGKILYIMEVISTWTQPLPRTQDSIQRAFQHALQASDLQIACYCSYHAVTYRFAVGQPLEEIAQEASARLAFVRKMGFMDVQYILLHTRSYAQGLRGLTRALGSLSWEEFDETSFEQQLVPGRMTTAQCWYWSFKMQARYMAGAFIEALEAGDKAVALAWSSLGQIQLLDLHLFHALTVAACFGTLTSEERAKRLEELRRHQQQLGEWARFSPSTFLAPERMVRAELARITGRHEEAVQAYEEALEAATEHDFIQYVALASELAARYWRERRVRTIADTYARRAREAYLQWGATAKVKHLDAQWPQLATAANRVDRDSLEADPELFNVVSLVKAQQLVSGELVLERLATTLLLVAIDNAGAQDGALLLPRGGKYSVVAVSGSPAEGLSVGMDESQLPASLLSYIRRTREHVLIGDTSQPHPFSADPWFQRARARSVLCLPLVRQEELLGVLYLENRLHANAFTAARLSLLRPLASQAAISLENARLYSELQRTEGALRQANDELEQRVEERTRELKQAQARLMETARAAGMAEVAANVLHNVGNVLTSAVINLQTMRKTVDSSRANRLKQVVALLEEQKGDLSGFFAKDPRGGRLPSYLAALSEELQRDQSSLREDMEAMDKHLEHIRAIVRVQQSHHRDPFVIEECDLAQLIADALSIQLPTLRRHDVTVTQELASLPPVTLEKHKVLQILINLFSNAKNAMSSVSAGERRLHVRLESVGNKARIQVVDNGVGISPEIRSRLFSQGFTTREGGHGLGLHSSALAARMLGGILTLDSEGPGKGATATLELPLE